MARILIVDGHALNRPLVEAYLDGSGYELVEAATGEQALAQAEAHPPDLVLLDVMMPGLDGFETTRRLKELAGEDFLPVLLLTSLSDSESRLRGLRMGADDFLTKPVDRQELAVRIKNLLALRQKEAALKEAKTSLIELMRFKDEMSQMIVHDLKNPMAVIVSNYEFLQEGAQAAGRPYLDALDDARAAAQRILRLLSNLLDVTRLEANRLDLRRTRIELSRLLRELMQQRKLMAESRGIAIEEGLKDVDLSGDRDLLTRVVENIFDNAMRYAPRGGKIEVKTEPAEDRVRIRIGNSGHSIPEAARAVIFEKFGQATTAAGRMQLGLGLYFCRLAAEAHGGRIWVEETAALPTVFVIELPV